MTFSAPSTKLTEAPQGARTAGRRAIPVHRDIGAAYGLANCVFDLIIPVFNGCYFAAEIAIYELHGLAGRRDEELLRSATLARHRSVTKKAGR